MKTRFLCVMILFFLLLMPTRVLAEKKESPKKAVALQKLRKDQVFISKDKVFKSKKDVDKIIRNTINNEKKILGQSQEKSQTLKSIGTNWENGAHRDSKKLSEQSELQIKAPKGFSTYQANKSEVPSIDLKNPRR